MPDTFGLMGANNPILQASQQMSQQAAQMRNAAAEGIVNQTLQSKTRQLAAEMESYNNLIQSKDPKLKMIGVKGLFERAGKDVPEDIQARFEEVTTASSDLAKLMKSNALPAVKKEAWDAFITEYGSDYVSPEMKPTALNQPITPDLAKQYGLPEGTTIEQARALGVNLADTSEKDMATASLREFETVNGIPSSQRGTPEYQKKYQDWLKVKNPGAGSGQVVIMPTAEGFVKIDKKTGQATPIQGEGGMPVNKPLTGEMITTQQQIGTVQDVFQRIKDSYKSEYTGAVQGRLGALKSVTTGNIPEQAAFQSNLQDLNNTLVYLKSGKQINEQEYERLKAAMPHQNLADSDFKARMVEFEKTLGSIINERQKAMSGYGKSNKSNLKSKYGLE